MTYDQMAEAFDRGEHQDVFQAALTWMATSGVLEVCLKTTNPKEFARLFRLREQERFDDFHKFHLAAELSNDWAAAEAVLGELAAKYGHADPKVSECRTLLRWYQFKHKMGVEKLTKANESARSERGSHDQV